MDTFEIIWRGVLSAVCAYLLGSISFAIIITRLFAHKDVRSEGSGNAGMTNVLRTTGKLPAVLTLVGDFGKAVGAIFLGKFIFSPLTFSGAETIGMYLAGLFVVIGHIFPVFFGFKGGKGVLTCAGVFFVLDPPLCTLAILIFLAVALISGYVSLGSILGLSSAPISTLIVGLTLRADTLTTASVLWQTLFIFLIAGISVFMHRGNIKRLLNGTENGFKKHQKNRNKQ